MVHRNISQITITQNITNQNNSKNHNSHNSACTYKHDKKKIKTHGPTSVCNKQHQIKILKNIIAFRFPYSGGADQARSCPATQRVMRQHQASWPAEPPQAPSPATPPCIPTKIHVYYYYIGETGRPPTARISEHRKAVTQGEMNKSEIAEHCLVCGKQICWRQCKTVTYEPNYMNR